MQRDIRASAFQPILADLVRRVSGTAAAALVDEEGEAVDYHLGPSSPSAFDVRVAAAHMRLLLAQATINPEPVLGLPRKLLVHADKRAFYGQILAQGYALVLVLEGAETFTLASRPLAVCERALHAEAGWPTLSSTRSWHDVEVACGVAGRPLRVASSGDASIAVHLVVGRVVGLGTGERGFRVRLSSGIECTLVRESSGRWYADEDPFFAPR